MSSLIGIELPAELRDRIAAFCNSNSYPICDLNIMLIGPNSLDGVRGIEHRLQSFCLAQPEFKVTVGTPSVYNDLVLYLNVQPGAINIAREQLAEKLNIGPERMVYRPHVTLVRRAPVYPADFAALLERARQAFREPYTFTVEAIMLYTLQQNGDNSAPPVAMPLTGR